MCVFAQIPVDYVPNEEEKRVFRECSHESFWYRCKFFLAHIIVNIVLSHLGEFVSVFHDHASFTAVPFSVISMAITQALVTRGNSRYEV